MKRKICTKCQDKLPLSCFSKKRSGQSSHCKNCHKEYSKLHYSSNKDYYKEKGKQSRDKLVQSNKEVIAKYKDKPCKDCDVKYPPYVMDFDHLRDKEFNISHALSLSLERIILEIEKCDVVCANCHRQRTHDRKQNDTPES